MTAWNVEADCFAGLDIEGFLGLGDAGSRFEGHAEHDWRSVRNAPVDSSGPVLGELHARRSQARPLGMKHQGIIMFGAFHAGG